MTTPTAGTANVQLRDASGQYVTMLSLPLGTSLPGVIVWERRAFVKGPNGYTETNAWVDVTGDFIAAAKADVAATLAEAHRLLLVVEGTPGKFRDDVRSLCRRIEQLFHRSKPISATPPASTPPAA